MVNDLDKAYLAGFFDGEGTIGIYRSKTGYFLMSVRMNTIDIKDLEHLYEKFGSIGIFNVYSNAGTTNYPQAYWVIQKRSEIVEFLNIILPFAKLKRDQICLMIDYCKYCDDHGGRLTEWNVFVRDSYARRLRSLKQPHV